MREFETGATRDDDANKPDYEGFLSPLVILEFGKYMLKHRQQADGAVRNSDNWQKGIPVNAYIKSKWRHFLDLWLHHRGYNMLSRDSIKEALCADLFNTMGYLHETLKEELAAHAPVQELRQFKDFPLNIFPQRAPVQERANSWNPVDVAIDNACLSACPRHKKGEKNNE
jgi:hypothetical protein